MFSLLLSRNYILKYMLLNGNASFHYSPFGNCCSRLYIAFRDCGIVVWLRETMKGPTQVSYVPWALAWKASLPVLLAVSYDWLLCFCGTWISALWLLGALLSDLNQLCRGSEAHIFPSKLVGKLVDKTNKKNGLGHTRFQSDSDIIHVCLVASG